jgi:hypothetical protein
LNYCKLTPETGEKEAKSNFDWSGSTFLHAFDMTKGYIDFDGDMIVVSGPRVRNPSDFRACCIFLSKTRMRHYMDSDSEEEDPESRWMF